MNTYSLEYRTLHSEAMSKLDHSDLTWRLMTPVVRFLLRFKGKSNLSALKKCSKAVKTMWRSGTLRLNSIPRYTGAVFGVGAAGQHTALSSFMTNTHIPVYGPDRHSRLRQSYKIDIPTDRVRFCVFTTDIFGSKNKRVEEATPEPLSRELKLHPPLRQS